MDIVSQLVNWELKINRIKDKGTASCKDTFSYLGPVKEMEFALTEDEVKEIKVVLNRAKLRILSKEVEDASRVSA